VAALHRNSRGASLSFSALAVAATLAGCVSPDQQTSPAEQSPERIEPATGDLRFRLDVVSRNREMARHLERHLELQRFADFPDLQAAELRRLLGAAGDDARSLLAAQGYFDPAIELAMHEPEKPGGPRRIVMSVETGERARVEQVSIEFTGAVADDTGGAGQRAQILRDWLLKRGETFTQEAWDAARAGGLGVLQRDRYPAARIADSFAVVNADTAEARLFVVYDSGPLYRFGELQLQGLGRYDTDGIRNIARIPVGEVYSEERLLDAQQRLVGSGYFDSAFLMLDTAGEDPEHARVIGQFTEAKEQKVVLGLGYSTDSKARLSIDHTHNRIWPLGWRAVNHADVGTNAQSLSTRWSDMPESSGWAWYTGLELERGEYGDYRANGLSWTGGRMRTVNHTERRLFVRYDASNARGESAPLASSSIIGNYDWTGRYFDDDLNPTSGHGYGLQAGVGFTLTPRRDPFLRVVLRGLHLLPFGGRNSAGKRNRIALRAEVGAIHADDDVDIPVRLLFLTGGDNTVRGYTYQSIGNRLGDDTIYGARYMAWGSIEWQRPFTLLGDARSFEQAVFVDAGAAADEPGEARFSTGVGTGLRWASPVGPLQLDAAYGTRTHEWRLHLRVGFQF
jgi:translocation and assembly module TamA